MKFVRRLSLKPNKRQILRNRNLNCQILVEFMRPRRKGCYFLPSVNILYAQSCMCVFSVNLQSDSDIDRILLSILPFLHLVTYVHVDMYM